MPSTSPGGSTGSANSTSRVNQIGFIGLAAALLGRNTAVGIGFASLLFGALINGTSGRQLDPSVFSPDLAGNLTTIIQGLVILFVGLNLTTLVCTAPGDGGAHDRDHGTPRPHRLAGPEDGRRRRDRPRRCSPSGSRCRRS